MRLKGILVTLIVLLALLVAVVNWQSMITPLPLNLLFFTAEVPLGLLLLVTAVGLSLLFFLLAYLERLSQLSQTNNLERHIDSLQAKLEQKRLTEIAGLEKTLTDRLTGLEGKIADNAERMEAATRSSITAFETHTQERLEQLQERVLLVRNELAADIAETEDALRRGSQRALEDSRDESEENGPT